VATAAQLDRAELGLTDTVIVPWKPRGSTSFCSSRCSRIRPGSTCAAASATVSSGAGRDRDLLVIIVSARGDPVDRVHGFARGCEDYVVKGCV
jgi:PleD family two-component response regulator